MKQLEGLVSYPWPKPAKRMVNGVPISDSESDEENKGSKASKKGRVLGPNEKQKIALVIDTNVLLKKTQLRELLKVPDLATFEELFEVVTLDSVIQEIRDAPSREYINNGLPYALDVKKAATFISKEEMI